MPVKKKKTAPYEFRRYLASEIRTMLAEVKPECPVASTEFNVVAMAWIEKNAARFRRRWDRCRTRKEEMIIGN
jgi:hypothetical protein